MKSLEEIKQELMVKYGPAKGFAMYLDMVLEAGEKVLKKEKDAHAR